MRRLVRSKGAELRRRKALKARKFGVGPTEHSENPPSPSRWRAGAEGDGRGWPNGLRLRVEVEDRRGVPVAVT